MGRGNPNIKEVGKSTRFSSDNQPKNNGRKGKTVSEWLREYGEAKELEIEVTVTKSNGEKKKNKAKVESVTTINQLIATTVIKKAVEGDNRAITTFLDRTEGRPKQDIDITSDGDKLNYNPIWGKVDPILTNGVSKNKGSG